MMQLRYLNERFEIDHRSGNKETASSEDPQREQCTDARLGGAPRHRPRQRRHVAIISTTSTTHTTLCHVVDHIENAGMPQMAEKKFL